ncbi:MAG: hydroxyisourate hydrolase [Demequina sp.]|uniref:hydroxyisourate hydrolase n=1 Tax=Demequina sp. TaxID=2050685 RepID=UPI003A88359F
MSHLTTHVLDAVTGTPAAGVSVTLSSREDGGWEPLASGVTDADGRIGELGPDRLAAGDYQVRFDTGMYFQRRGVESFYPEVVITFSVGDGAHYHVPLLLSPFAYSTYRGS